MASSVQAGATPLPSTSAGSPVRVTFSPPLQNQPAAQAVQLSTFSAKPGPLLNASLLGSNANFVVYAVKNGLLRILSTSDSSKGLLRGHVGQTVSDIEFFHQADIVASVAAGNGASTLMVSRVSKVSAEEIHVDVLLEFKTQHFTISRAVWHPFDMNQLCVIHTNALGVMVGTLINTNAIRTTLSSPEQGGHSVCVFASDYEIQQGATVISDSTADLLDFAWSTAERYVLSTHDNGRILLHDWKQQTCLVALQEEGPVSRCLFLPQLPGSQQAQKEQATTATPPSTYWTPPFLTATDNNATVTLWSAFTADGKAPTKLQVFGLENPSTSYLLDVCADHVLMADRTAGQIYAWHVGTASHVCDYVVPFSCKYPTYSWHARLQAGQGDDTDEAATGLDICLHAYQSMAVQKLTLTSVMLLPPASTWVDPTPGVQVERLWPEVHSAHVSDIGSDADILQYDEEYDVSDVEEEPVVAASAPDPASLPSPEGIVTTTTPTASNNVFANWLGNLAAKNTPAPQPAPAPMPPPVTPGVVDPAILASLPVPPAAADLPLPVSDPAIIPPSAADLPSPLMATSNSHAPPLVRQDTPVMSNASPQEKQRKNKTPPPAKTNNRNTAAPTAAVVDGDAIAEQVRQVVRQELKEALIPTVEKAVQSSVQESIIRPIQASIAQLASTGVQVDHERLSSSLASSVDVPLRAAFASNMKTALVPALNSMMGQVLEQVSTSLEVKESSKNKDLEAMSAQLSTMTSLVATLTKEVQSLKEVVASSTVSRASQAPTQSIPAAAPKAAEDIRPTILQLSQKGSYTEAFNLALSKADARYTLFCCENCSFDDIFGGEAIKVSQVVLICIMQHLSLILRTSVVDSQLDLSLKWLQEIALSMNPPAPEIREHLPKVLGELARSINTRMEQGDQVRRHRDFNRLLQFVRGIQF